MVKSRVTTFGNVIPFVSKKHGKKLFIIYKVQPFHSNGITRKIRN